MATASVISYRPADDLEYPTFLRMIYEHTTDFLEPSLMLLGLDQAEFEYLFRTRGKVFSILKEQQLAGFYWVEEREETLHIHALFVSPEFQKQGIAREVIRHIEGGVSLSIDRIELGVHRDNHRAKGIYEAAGFKVRRELEDFDFFVLEKSLL